MIREGITQFCAAMNSDLARTTGVLCDLLDRFHEGLPSVREVIACLSKISDSGSSPERSVRRVKTYTEEYYEDKR